MAIPTVARKAASAFAYFDKVHKRLTAPVCRKPTVYESDVPTVAEDTELSSAIPNDHPVVLPREPAAAISRKPVAAIPKEQAAAMPENQAIAQPEHDDFEGQYSVLIDRTQALVTKLEKLDPTYYCGFVEQLEQLDTELAYSLIKPETEAASHWPSILEQIAKLSAQIDGVVARERQEMLQSIEAAHELLWNQRDLSDASSTSFTDSSEASKEEAITIMDVVAPTRLYRIVAHQQSEDLLQRMVHVHELHRNQRDLSDSSLGSAFSSSARSREETMTLVDAVGPAQTHAVLTQQIDDRLRLMVDVHEQYWN